MSRNLITSAQSASIHSVPLQVALLGAPPPSWKDDGQDHHGDDVDEKGFNPVKRLAALARSPCGLALIVLGTIMCVTFLFLLRRSVFFNVLYEVYHFHISTTLRCLHVTTALL